MNRLLPPPRCQNAALWPPTEHHCPRSITPRPGLQRTESLARLPYGNSITPTPQQLPLTAAPVRVGDPRDSPSPSPTLGDSQTHIPPSPPLANVHVAHFSVGREGTASPRAAAAPLTTAPQSCGAQQQLPTNDRPPQGPRCPPPIEKRHPHFSFFVLNSPVIWFPKYRRGRGNV